MSNERGSQLLRQWHILIACQIETGLSVEEIVSKLKVGRRTIYRDLKILKSAGAQIETIRVGNLIKYRTEQPFFPLDNTVTPNDTPGGDPKSEGA